MDKPCGEDCYGKKEKCGNECVVKGENKRECVEDGIVKCIQKSEPCNGECSDPENYFPCGSECKPNWQQSYWRDCVGDCIRSDEQCNGKCDHEGDTHFECGNKCKPNNQKENWRTCT